MRKGQAAMEFLMTYGWAILIVLIAIGALVYFGVISPERFVQDSCTLTPPLSCSQLGNWVAFSEDSDNVQVVVSNGAGSTVTIDDASITETDGNACTRTDIITDIADGASGQLTFTCNDLSATTPLGTRFKGDLIVVYSVTGGTFNQSSTGQVVTRVQ